MNQILEMHPERKKNQDWGTLKQNHCHFLASTHKIFRMIFHTYLTVSHLKFHCRYALYLFWAGKMKKKYENFFLPFSFHPCECIFDVLLSQNFHCWLHLIGRKKKRNGAFSWQASSRFKSTSPYIHSVPFKLSLFSVVFALSFFTPFNARTIFYIRWDASGLLRTKIKDYAWKHVWL